MTRAGREEDAPDAYRERLVQQTSKPNASMIVGRPGEIPSWRGIFSLRCAAAIEASFARYPSSQSQEVYEASELTLPPYSGHGTFAGTPRPQAPSALINVAAIRGRSHASLIPAPSEYLYGRPRDVCTISPRILEAALSPVLNHHGYRSLSTKNKSR